MDDGGHETGVRNSFTFPIRVHMQTASLNTQLSKATSAKHFGSNFYSQTTDEVQSRSQLNIKSFILLNPITV